MDQLLGGYPALNLHDPETYIAKLVALLCGVSLWVGQRAVQRVASSPEWKFIPPSVAGMVEACEHFAPSRSGLDWADEWDARAQAQLEERAQIEAGNPVGEQERVAAGFERLLAHLGRGDPKRPMETAETVRAKFNLTQEQWDALPNLPERKQQRWTGKI